MVDNPEDNKRVFKPGDRVRCIDNRCKYNLSLTNKNLELGKIYTVTLFEEKTGGNMVSLDKNPSDTDWMVGRFVLADSIPEDENFFT